MEYPDHKTYAVLYARYFRKDRLDALLKGLPIRGGVTLDLCCGEGRVSLEALRRGASNVVAVDMRSDMIPKSLRSEVDVWKNSVERVLKHWQSGPVRVAICQQAVNYWLSRETAKQLYGILEKDGVFAFNTFVNCPSKTPRAMNYELEGKQYWECSQLIGSAVHHVQVCEGLPSHTTAFQWLSEDTIREMLFGLFDIQLFQEGSSAIYHCTRLGTSHE